MVSTSKSEQLMQRAQKFIPGGVNSPVRSFRSVGGKPFAAAKGEGAYLVDVDHHRYIDLVCSWGALIHGHANAEISEAAIDAMKLGTSFGITSEPEVNLCELMTTHVKSLEMVRLVNSGTEACMSAIRLARGATKRSLILKFEGHYHGHADSFLVAAGSGVATLQQADSAGVPEEVVGQTLVVAFNDTAAVERVFEKYGPQIAGAILEVVSGNMGVVEPTFDFLQALRRLTTKYSSVLIFDEVMTGFRLSLSGAQGIYGIQPDLMTLGKIIGGGFPVGAYGGKRDLMQHISPLGSVYQAGTLSGNPVGSSAGHKALEIILRNEKLFYQSLDYEVSRWTEAVASHVKMHSYPITVVRSGSMASIFFRAEAPKNFADTKDVDLDRFKKFFWKLLESGVYYPPSAFEACFLSAAHTGPIIDELTEETCRAIDWAFKA